MKGNDFAPCYGYKIKSKKGFSLIEFLLIITIMGILASVVLVSLSGAGGKANRAAFVEEVSVALPWFLTTCAGGDILSIPPASSNNVNWTVPASSDQSCGPNKPKTFCVKATNKNDFVNTTATNCVVYINQDGALFWNSPNCSSNSFTSSHCK